MPLSILTANVTSDTPSGSILRAGASVIFTLNSGVVLTLTGTPQLQLSNGEVANYIGTDANGKPQFKYNVVAGDDTSDLKVGGLVGATVTVLGLTVQLNLGSGTDTGIVIDTAAPGTPAAPTLAAGSDTGISSTDGITSATTPTLNGTAEAGSTVKLYDGTTQVGTAAVAANGTYAVTSSTLGSGTHSLHVTATDAAGNVSASSGNTSITIDLAAPATPAAPTLTTASDTGVSSTDGITSDATPTFTGSAEVGSTITLYDGTTAVGTATVGANGTYAVTASNLGDGAHALHITATDAAGNVSASSGNVSIIVDTSAPATPAAPTLDAASDTGASATDGITSDATPTFTGSAAVGSTITLYDGTTQVGTATVGANGTYAVTASNLGDGAHALSVTATDAAGNVSAKSGVVNVVIDTSTPTTPAAPTLDATSDTGASATDGITSDATPTFNGSAAVGSTITLYDGTTAVGTATVGANGTYAVTASNLGDGAHALSVTATNAAGNVSATSGVVNVTIDTSTPTTPAAPTLDAASDTGISATDGITSDATPTFNGSAAVGSTVTLYDGTTAVGTATVGANGTYAVTAANLGDGDHTLHVTATNAAGTMSASSGNVSVTIDTSTPATPAGPTLDAASDTGASSADGITGDATPTFSGSAEVGSTVTLYDGATQVGTATVGANGTYSVTASNLGDGDHALRVTTTNAAGTVSASSGIVNVTIDTSTPATPASPTIDPASDTGASSTDGITSDATPTFTGSAEVGSTVTLYDGMTQVGTATVGSNGTYSVTASNLGDGDHTLHVTATDASGNVSTSSGNVSITIDTSAPATPASPTLDAASDTGASSTDGITSDATPTFSGSAEVGSTVTLYDGTTAVGTATVGSNGAYSVTASNLGDGDHTLHVTATDAGGNVSVSSSNVSITIDTSTPATPAAPTLNAASDTGASSTDGITRDATPTFSGSAEVGSTVTLYDGTTQVGTATVGANGKYSITSSALAEGAHTLHTTVSETAGNRSASSAGKTITIDTSAPARPVAPTLTAASNTGVSSTDGITSDATPTFTGAAEAGSKVTLYDGSNAVSSATANANGSYSITSASLSDGTHKLSVRATDVAGNISLFSPSRFVTIDTTAPDAPSTPKLSLDTGTSSRDGITKVAAPVVVGRTEAGSTVVLYDGTKVVGTARAGAGGAYSIKSSTLADGMHSLSVKATDAAGNVGAASGSLAVVIDTRAPARPVAPTLTAASNTGVSSTDGITSDATPTFTGAAEAGSKVTLYDGSDAVSSATANANGSYSITSASLSDGTHKLSVRATDVAGNISLFSPSRFVTIDTTAPDAPSTPKLSLDTGTSSRDGITKVAAPVVVGRTEAGSTVVLYDGTKVVGTARAGAGGAYSIKSSTLADGMHSLSVKATDAAGNVGAASGSLAVVIDTRAPARPVAPTLTAASNTGVSSTDGITSDATPTFTGAAEAGSKVTLYDGSDAVSSATANANGSYSITSASLSDGTHKLSVRATDVAGNISLFSPSRFVTIDTTAPDAPSTPKLSLDTGTSSRDGITKVAAPVVVGRTEAGSTVVLYDGTKVVGTARAGAGGAYSIKSSTLADGMHSLSVKATDAAGNVGAASGSLAVVIDTRAPARPVAPTLTAASNTGVSSTDGITSDATPTFTGAAEAGSKVTLYDGSNAVSSATANANGSYSITSASLSDGTHKLSVRATDVAGNISLFSPSRFVTIDTTAPDVAINTTGGPVTSATQTVRGTGEAGTSVMLTNNGTAIGPAVRVGSNGTWSEKITLSSGTNNIVATDTDKAGNAGTSQAVAYEYTPAASARASSLNNMVQAMSTMAPSSSSSMTPTASGPSAEAHPLAAAH